MNKIYFHLNKTIECDPDFSDAHVMLAQEYRNDRDIPHYLEHINRALKIDKRIIKRLTKLHQRYADQNLFGLARKIFFQQIEQKSHLSNLLVELGKYYFNNEELNIAKKCFSEAKAVNPLNADVFYNQGIVYQKNRKYKKAYKSFIHCIEREILHIGGNIELGKHYQRKKDYNLSEVHFFCALESNPYDPFIHLMICNLYLKMEKLATAKHHYLTGIALDKSLKDLKLERKLDF